MHPIGAQVAAQHVSVQLFFSGEEFSDTGQVPGGLQIKQITAQYASVNPFCGVKFIFI